jgi:hypothetical protein
LVTGASFLRPVPRLARAAAIVYLVLTVAVAMGVDRWSVESERAREAVGVAICAVWMLAVSRMPGGRAGERARSARAGRY